MKSPHALLVAGIMLAPAFLAAAENEQAVEHFERKIRPVLVERCWKCHGEKEQENGLRLDSREAALKGGATGRAIRPGEPEASLVIKALKYTDDDLKMPPDGKLPDSVIA